MEFDTVGDAESDGHAGWRHRVADTIDSFRHRNDRLARFGPGHLPPLHSTRRPDAEWRVGVLVFQGVTSNEIDEPVRRIADRLHADLVFVGVEVGRVQAVEPARTVDVDITPDDAPDADVLVIPGGIGWERLVADLTLMAWLTRNAQHARAVLAISTGSLLLAAAGRLEGQKSTGHWLARDDLARLGAAVQSDRIVRSDDGRIVTASGAHAALSAIDELLERVLWDVH
ncbi:DJ-1/PfpI family protein [Ilumatobacter sp.]|uniref:DJ-1/PfpI family protein n=1 Tax=Ilumatobacter sp. TaxID=1967498 RepID=UPI003C415A58